jgi:hypothetical protein
MRNFISPRSANLTGGQSPPLHGRNYIVDLAIRGHGYSEMQKKIASLDEEFYFTQVGQPYYIVDLVIHGHDHSEM